MNYNYDSLNSSSKNTENSYEEESLIDSYDPKLMSKENIYDFKLSKKSQIPKDLDIAKTENVIAAIDPTYWNRINPKESKAKDEKDVFIVNNSKSKKSGYSSIGDNDTEIFLPIQGQKRGTIKSIKKKRSQTQCLQQ